VQASASDAADIERKLRDKIQSLTADYDEAQEKISALQSDVRSKRSEVDDAQGMRGFVG
jgi:peptidoglycan hydrolase CwlO-like protein